jgi:hypothetical protein
MSDDRGTRRQPTSTLPETPQPDGPADEPYAEIEPAEDTVPYLPPLASYRIQARWGEVRHGVPTVFPEDDAGPEEIEG